MAKRDTIQNQIQNILVPFPHFLQTWYIRH